MIIYLAGTPELTVCWYSPLNPWALTWYSFLNSCSSKLCFLSCHDNWKANKIGSLAVRHMIDGLARARKAFILDLEWCTVSSIFEFTHSKQAHLETQEINLYLLFKFKCPETCNFKYLQRFLFYLHSYCTLPSYWLKMRRQHLKEGRLLLLLPQSPPPDQHGMMIVQINISDLSL